MNEMGILVSLIAVVISLAALIRTREFNNKLLSLEEENSKLSKLQRRILERDEEERLRCHISSYWYEGLNNSDGIAIANSGAVSAFNINFNFKPKKGRISPAVESVMKDSFPIDELRPDEERTFLIAPSMRTDNKWPAIIYWENEAGEKYEKDVILGK